EKLPLDEFAAALGLPGTPKIVFKKGRAADADAAAADNADVKALKNKSRRLVKEVEAAESSSSEEDDIDGTRTKKEKKKPAAVRTKYDRMSDRKNQTVLAEHYSRLHDTPTTTSTADDDFFTTKRVLSASPEPSDPSDPSTIPRLTIPGTNAPLIID